MHSGKLPLPPPLPPPVMMVLTPDWMSLSGEYGGCYSEYREGGMIMMQLGK